jgi:hypothetical protein
MISSASPAFVLGVLGLLAVLALLALLAVLAVLAVLGGRGRRKRRDKQKGRGRNLCLIRCVGRRPLPAGSDHTGLIKKYQ